MYFGLNIINLLLEEMQLDNSHTPSFLHVWDTESEDKRDYYRLTQ